MSQGARDIPNQPPAPRALVIPASKPNSPDPKALHQLRAFLRIDAIDDWSTPNRLLQQATLITTGLIILHVVSGQIVSPPHYFAYSVIGLAMMDLMVTSLGSLSLKPRAYQASGRLEAIMMTGTPLWRVILFASFGDLLRSLSRCAIYLAVIVVTSSAVASAQWLTALLFFGLGFAVMLALGLLSASIALILHRGDPLAWLHGLASLLIAGVLYPTSALPGIFNQAARILPLTPLLRGLRGALLEGQTLTHLQGHLTHLAVFALVLIPLAVALLRYVTRWIFKEGASPIS